MDQASHDLMRDLIREARRLDLIDTCVPFGNRHVIIIGPVSYNLHAKGVTAFLDSLVRRHALRPMEPTE